MVPRTRFVFLAVVSLTAAACGLKGPLYRPDEPRRESSEPASPAETQKKKDTSSSSTAPGEQSEPVVAPPDPDRPVVPPDR